MINEPTILVGEAEPEVRGDLEMALQSMGYRVELAQDERELLGYVRNARSGIGAVVLDVMMPPNSGLGALRAIRALDPGIPIIMISGITSARDIVAAMKNGAVDFLCKPVANPELRAALTRALELRGSERAARPATLAASGGNGERVFRSCSPGMRGLEDLVPQVAPSDAPVLIQGETGSGKEVLARQIHANSPRANMPFLKLNCAALPSELVESELFGYERGAFTGAFQKKVGMFEVADGGTILLDEIGDMDVRLQAKLLQVLQDYQFRRIGGDELIRVDVRVIAATHRDLEKSIADRAFREDLYYRLNVINMQLPPLRERRGDIIPLAEFMARRYASARAAIPPLTQELKYAFLTYHWPGNVREMENIMRRYLILQDSENLILELHLKSTPKPSVSAADLMTRVAVPGPIAHNGHVKESSVLEEAVQDTRQAETDIILAALDSSHWNRKKAAELLKIGYRVLLHKMKKLGIERTSVPARINGSTLTMSTASGQDQTTGQGERDNRLAAANRTGSTTDLASAALPN